jgi:hypothetical protein
MTSIVTTAPGSKRGTAANRPPQKNRRRHPRVPVGLPVEVHIADSAKTIVVELVDIAKAGVRFRSLGEEVKVGQRATFTFTVEGQGNCSAEGQVARVHSGNEFIVVLEKANPKFRDFVLSLTK